MKLSIVILSAAFLGVISYLGPEAGRSMHDHHGSWKHIGERNGDSTDFSFSSTRTDDPTLRELRALESGVEKRIRDVESALRKIASSQAFLKRRLEALSKECSDIWHSPCRGREKGMLQSSEEALLQQFKALEEERVAFSELLERLKSEQTSLKVKIDLWGVKAKRAMVEEFLGDDVDRGPLDGLREDVKYRSQRMAGNRGIVF